MEMRIISVYACVSSYSYDWLAFSFKITSDFELWFWPTNGSKSNTKKGNKTSQLHFSSLWEGHYKLWRCFLNKIRFCHCLLFPSAFHFFSLNHWASLGMLGNPKKQWRERYRKGSIYVCLLRWGISHVRRDTFERTLASHHWTATAWTPPS